MEPDGSSRSMLAVGEFRLAADTASGPMYVHAGLEGSVIALTNVLGELVERYRYTAFGLLTVLDAEGEEKDSPALSPWLYHGRLYENESGLYWMRMRHYSPDLGRFLQPDPAGIAGGINLYAYSNNNPLRYFDPWGLWPAPDATGGDDGKYGETWGMCLDLDPSEIEKVLRRLAIIGKDRDPDALKGHKKYVERRKKEGYYEDYIIATGLEDAVSQLDELGVRWDQIDFYGHGVDGRQKMGRTLYPDDYGAFRPYLNDGSSINLMGCDTAGGDNPEGIIQMTADYSGATVTGHKGKYHYMFNIRLYSPFDWFGPKSITRSPQPNYDPMQ